MGSPLHPSLRSVTIKEAVWHTTVVELLRVRAGLFGCTYRVQGLSAVSPLERISPVQDHQGGRERSVVSCSALWPVACAQGPSCISAPRRHFPMRAAHAGMLISFICLRYSSASGM